MERSKTPPDEFIASLPDGVRNDMTTLDAIIAEAFAGDERVLWEGKFWGGTQQNIVGYGAYHYKGRSGAEGEWFVVGLAAQKNYLSLYVNATADGQYLGKVYAPRLGKVKAGSANLQFKRAADLDLDVLRELATAARDSAPTEG
ncbi:MAG TPA: DUF1801 domain-containing protein [Candidatus Limnocylindria bacterium]|jgi:uncharacterized protein (DUF2147 family)